MLVQIAGRIRFPCDDSYENLRTGEVAIFYCTPEAHFRGLLRVDKAKTIREILAVPGVKLHKRYKPEWSELVAKRVRLPKRKRVPSEAEKRQLKTASRGWALDRTRKRAPKSAALGGSAGAPVPRRALASKKPAGGRHAPTAKGARPAAPSPA